MSDGDWLKPEALEIERLAAMLSGSELQSLLLRELRRRASARAVAEVVAQYRNSPFCQPALVDQRTSTEVDAHLLAAADAFEAVELAPVAPLGTCSSFAVTDQNRVLSALRQTEVVADPTNVLALECASRLRVRPDVPVHLATSQRVVRAQPVPKLPGFTQHFRIFALASGGRESQDHAFTLECVLLHIRSMLRALDRLEQYGYDFGARRVVVLTTQQKQRLGQRVIEALNLECAHQPLEHAYYSGGLRYQVWLQPGDEAIPLIDGGVFDWLATLAQNRRLVYVASGAGAQLIPLRFRRTA
jgi:hypothetical protein